MAQFLIDENLPYYFSLWNNEYCIHVADIKSVYTDEEIWSYALTNKLTIISKDADFSNRILHHSPPPRVVHIKLGNLKLNQLYEALKPNWGQILQLSKKYKLVNVYADRIESIE
ncbi:MAG: hypothetical protein CMC96_08875 [Flavobacteriales bacterium]|nr:hypothetical protein [Flavobacteriales bacterium]